MLLLLFRHTACVRTNTLSTRAFMRFSQHFSLSTLLYFFVFSLFNLHYLTASIFPPSPALHNPLTPIFGQFFPSFFECHFFTLYLFHLFRADTCTQFFYPIKSENPTPRESRADGKVDFHGNFPALLFLFLLPRTEMQFSRCSHFQSCNYEAWSFSDRLFFLTFLSHTAKLSRTARECFPTGRR